MQSEKKNIILIGSAYPLRGGGMSSFNERLAKALQDAGHSVEIYTFSLQYPSFLFPGTSQYSNEAPPKGLSIRVLINSINPLNWIKVGHMIRKAKPDIIIIRYWLPFMGPCFGTILRIAKKNHHSRIVCIADNIIPHEKRFGDRAFTAYFLKPVDAFITMSKKVLKDLESFKVSRPVQLVPHPLYDNFGEKISKEAARNELGLAPDNFILLFFGFVRKYKGLDILLDAMPAIIKNIPSAKLLVAGEFYENKELYAQQVERLGIGAHVIIQGDFIPDNQIRNYLCAADVVVQPYRNATQSGVTPLAYHFEVPMIVTNVGGLPDMVPHNQVGMVAEPDAASLAAAVTAFFQKGAGSFIANIAEEKKKYSWGQMVTSILQSASENKM